MTGISYKSGDFVGFLSFFGFFSDIFLEGFLAWIGKNSKSFRFTFTLTPFDPLKTFPNNSSDNGFSKEF
jgi:hypothetical protein